MFLEDKFGIDGLYSAENWIRRLFDSWKIFPQKELEELTTQLEGTPALFIEVVSFKPELGHLEAHFFSTKRNVQFWERSKYRPVFKGCLRSN